MHAVRSSLSCIVVAIAIVIATSAAAASRFTATSEALAAYLTLHRD
jgi:hypothetical protein